MCVCHAKVLFLISYEKKTSLQVYLTFLPPVIILTFSGISYQFTKEMPQNMSIICSCIYGIHTFRIQIIYLSFR